MKAIVVEAPKPIGLEALALAVAAMEAADVKPKVPKAPLLLTGAVGPPANKLKLLLGFVNSNLLIAGGAPSDCFFYCSLLLLVLIAALFGSVC